MLSRSVLCFLVAGRVLSAQLSPPPDPATAAFANRLFDAPSAADRAALLEQSPSQVSPALVKAMNQIAGQAFDRRLYPRAASLYAITCEVAVKAADRRDQAVCLYDQGLAELRSQRTDDARRHIEAALPLYRESGDSDGLVRCLNSLGILVRGTGDFRGSLPYFEQALSAAASETAVAQSNTNMASSLLRLGNLRGAVQCLQRALAITRKLGMERESALVLTNLGSAYFEQGDLERSLDYSRQALAIKEKTGGPGELATALLNLGVAYNSAGDSTRAREYFDRALKLAAEPGLLPLRLTILFNYGNMLYELHDNQRAREMLEHTVAAADESGNAPEAAIARMVLARMAVDEADYDRGLELARAAAGYGRWSGQTELLAEALDVQGVALHDTGRMEQAYAAFDESIQALEGLRAQIPSGRQGAAQFLDKRRSMFLHMIDLELDRRCYESALSYVERSKARSLLDTLRLGNPAITRTMTPAEAAREGALTQRIEQLREAVLRLSRAPNPDRKRLDAVGAQLTAARADYRFFEDALYAAHPRLKVARAAFDAVPSDQLLGAAPEPSATLFDYSVTDSGVVLFVLSRSAPGLRVYRLSKSAAALKRDVERFRSQIATRDLGYRDLARSLYRDLVQPAAAQLPPGATLVISPDSFLWNLPFQALSPSSGRALLEDHPLFYTPSLTVLFEMRKLREPAPSAPARVLAIDAVGLPAEQREVDGMRPLYGASRVRILSGASADVGALRREAPDYDILHLAAHGVFDNRNPLNSYLLLAKDGKPEAGVFEAREWLDLSLHATMVVLSGCETGRGQAAGGEGLLGMAWALFIAGSPATLASEWMVESDSTSRLMLEFHRGAQRQPKSTALRAAALAVMKNPAWRHPFYWSGFELIGDGF